MRFLLVVFCSFLAGHVSAQSLEYPLGENSLFTERATSERLKPTGMVCMAGEPCAGKKPGENLSDASAAGPTTPDGIYNTYCSACHNTGAAGAPKMGDEAAWQARLAKGTEAVIAAAIKGVGAMPPKGTCMTCSDDDIAGVVHYMLAESGIAVEQGGAASAPVAAQADQEVAPDGADQSEVSGELVYEQRCAVCHKAGIAGAPKLGDGDAWASRTDKGLDTLVTNAIRGVGAMPPRGTCADCSDEEIAAAVGFMVDSL